MKRKSPPPQPTSLKPQLSEALQQILKNVNKLSEEELLLGFNRSALVSLPNDVELSLTVSLKAATVEPPLQLPAKRESHVDGAS